MANIDILVANEPRTYRQVIGTAFGIMRPEVRVTSAEPERMDEEIERLDPQLVICSQLTEALEASARAWILLYPGGEGHAVICVGGRRETIPGVELEDLLSVIDRVALLAQGQPESGDDVWVHGRPPVLKPSPSVTPA